jgi:cytochrome oxidase Cu insertion factor (SCO1/SenC/PrrC family)
MKRLNFLSFLLVFGPALLLVFVATRSCKHNFTKLERFGKLPSYEFIDAKGQKRTSKEFENEVIIFTTLQKSCPYSCAISFYHVNQILFQHIRKNNHKQLKKVRIISFVTDGLGNEETGLQELQQTMNEQVEGYDPNLWILAKGDAKTIYNITHNNQNLLQEGSKYFGGHAFQELLLLVDKQNNLRMVLKGNQEGLVRRMKESLALLLKQYDQERAGH